MLKIKGQIYKTRQLWPQLSISKNYQKQSGQFHQPDATPEELRLIEERRKIRQALRQEYLRKATDPHSTDPIIFDPLMQRYYSMHMTAADRFIPTFKNWCTYMCSIILPIIFYAQYLKNARDKRERQIRSGEIGYNERIFWTV